MSSRVSMLRRYLPCRRKGSWTDRILFAEEGSKQSSIERIGNTNAHKNGMIKILGGKQSTSFSTYHYSSFRRWSSSSSSGVESHWMEMYTLLKEYHKEHKSTIVPECCCDNEDHLQISKWVKEQRLRKNKGLTAFQKDLLNAIGFVWDYQEAKWLEQYERLCRYESQMPAQGQSSDLESFFEKRYQKDPVLRRWVNAQRLKYRKESISAEKVRLLDQVEGFVWDVKEARWAEMYRRLKVFASKNKGSCIVPQNYPPDPQLAYWVSNQRQRKKSLTAERIRLLEELGFVWDVREIQWLETYEKYKARFFTHKWNGSLKEEQQLNEWAVKQRYCYRNGTLSPLRIQRLEALQHPKDGHGFAWDPQERSWMDMYHELEDYRSKHNHVRVPTRLVDEDHKQLGIWAANQRRALKRGQLSEKRRKLLDKIDFVWDVYQAQWEDLYQRLLDYQQEQTKAGRDRSMSTMVPQQYEKDPQLAIWVKEQRQSRKNGSLSEDRQDLLDAIGFVWDAYNNNNATTTDP